MRGTPNTVLLQEACEFVTAAASNGCWGHIGYDGNRWRFAGEW